MDRRDFLKSILTLAAFAPVSRISTAVAAPAAQDSPGKVSRRRYKDTLIIAYCFF